MLMMAFFWMHSSLSCLRRLELFTTFLVLSGQDRLFVDLEHVKEHDQESLASPSLGWYEIEHIQGLIDWLDTGSENERELAEELYQAFCTQLIVIFSHPSCKVLIAQS